MLHAGLMSLMAEVQNDIWTSKVKKERIRGFLEKKNWKCLSPHIPLGYTETDDGWLEVDPKQKPIAQDMFRKFVECQEYAKTERYIKEEYGNWTLEMRRVKTLLQNPVYIGKPQVPEKWTIETTFENDLNEPQLNILEGEEDLFHQAQEIIAEKDKKHSTSDEAKDLLDFIEE